jgi:hypothetical protein
MNDKEFYNRRSYSSRCKITGLGVKNCYCYYCDKWRFDNHPDSKKQPVKVTSDLKHPLRIAAINVADEAINLLVQKHKDYGPNSISLSPGGPLNGLIVRLHDKVQRADNLLRTDSKPNNESLRDTFIDILNYAIISLLVVDKQWDQCK